LLLLVLTLTSTVSFAQGGQQGPSAEVDAVVDQPPHPPEPEPPEITLPPAGPGEDVYIGEVAIGSAEQLATLQQLGYGCGQSALCEIEATEAQVSALQEAGFAVDIVGVVAESRAPGEVESSDEVGALEAYRYGSRFTDIPIPTLSSATSPINISGAPSGARVTRVKYEVRVVVTGLMGGVNQYTLEIRPASASAGHTIWNREGGATDRGRDDDAADDRDIFLSNRWISHEFDGQPVNQPWGLRATCHSLMGAGEIDYWKLWVYYCTDGPGAPTLTMPAIQAHVCDTTPKFDWTSVGAANRYNIQVDDRSDFTSPAINTSSHSSDYTPTTPLGRTRWYWRVRSHNECGYGPWSGIMTFWIHSSPAVPALLAPANGAHTTDTTPTLSWNSATGATSYRVEVDRSPTFASPVTHGTSTASSYPIRTSLPPGQYYWRVRSENACYRSAWSSVRHFFIDPATMNRPPTNGTLTPNSGAAPAGRMVFFTSNYNDPDGEADLKACRLHIGRWAAPKSLAGNAVVLYQARTNKILLRNDRGTRWWGGRLVGSSNVVQNGQVKVYCARTTVTRGGTRIEVRWALEFKPAFRGRTKIYLKARDLGGLTSDLEQRGVWTVQ
jgi:hypothetical protein